MVITSYFWVKVVKTKVMGLSKELSVHLNRLMILFIHGKINCKV